MGMYTEFYVNMDFKKNTPKKVIDTIKAMCDRDDESKHLKEQPDRWSYMFNNGSYYFASTYCGKMTYNDIGECWSLLAKGDIKNYGGEIEEFFDFVMPWAADEDTFIGYYRYEENREPTLIYSKA